MDVSGDFLLVSFFTAFCETDGIFHVRKILVDHNRMPDVDIEVHITLSRDII